MKNNKRSELRNICAALGISVENKVDANIVGWVGDYAKMKDGTLIRVKEKKKNNS